MLIDVFDVGHGACAVVTAPNGKRIMIDCGERPFPAWSPSEQYQGERFEALVVQNLDADHLTAYEETCRSVIIGSVVINNTIDASRLRLLKSTGMSDGVVALYHSLLLPAGVINMPFDISPVRVSIFRHSFGLFTDTNNLSLVTFVEYGDFCMMFTGDIEEDGWEAGIRSPNPNFLRLLARTTVMMPSHHGRKNGCCDRLFSFCKPQVFIVSDKERIHETQETCDWYRSRALGALVGKWPSPETRYFMTTRNDGCITIKVNPDGKYYTLYPNSDRQMVRIPKPSSFLIPEIQEIPGLSTPSNGLLRSLAALSGNSEKSVPLSSLLAPFPPPRHK